MTTEILPAGEARTRAIPAAVLDQNLSIYLDLLRLVAAVEVVLGHARHFVMPRLPGFLSGHTGEAVAIFFVLSGFVIAFVADRKERTLRSYATARLSRLFSVCLIALASNVVFDAISRHYGAQPLTALPYYNGDYLGTLPFSLTFTNELWFSHRVFGTNEPYWSLGFEAAYYAIFAAFFYGGRRRGAILGVGLMLFFGPKIVAYMPIWLIGYATYHLLRTGRIRLHPAMAAGGFVVSIGLYLIVKRTMEHWASPMFEPVAAEQLARSFVYFAIVGLLVAVNIVALRQLAPTRRLIPDRVAAAIRWMAGASFTLYLVHQPFLVMLSSLFPGIRTSAVAGGAAILATFALALVLAELGERRKRTFQSAFGRILGVAPASKGMPAA